MMKRLMTILVAVTVLAACTGQNNTPVSGVEVELQNPILPGFHPDPSVVAMGEDYYLINSSFH